MVLGKTSAILYMTSSWCIAKINRGKRTLEGCFWTLCCSLWVAGLSWVTVMPPHIGRFDVEPPDCWEQCSFDFCSPWDRYSCFLVCILEGFWMHESGYSAVFRHLVGCLSNVREKDLWFVCLEGRFPSCVLSVSVFMLSSCSDSSTRGVYIGFPLSD